MICAGDKLENPVTGEILIFHRTARQTGGAAVRVETILRPHGFVAAAHGTPTRASASRCSKARLGLRVGDRELVTGPGQVLTVPAGTPHRFWNAGERRARFVCEVRPALAFKSLIETMFTLAAEGKTNRKGLPNPLRLAAIARSHFDTVRLPFPPDWTQRTTLALGTSTSAHGSSSRRDHPPPALTPIRTDPLRSPGDELPALQRIPKRLHNLRNHATTKYHQHSNQRVLRRPREPKERSANNVRAARERSQCRFECSDGIAAGTSRRAAPIVLNAAMWSTAQSGEVSAFLTLTEPQPRRRLALACTRGSRRMARLCEGRGLETVLSWRLAERIELWPSVLLA